jgi:hypothetical protein
MSRRVHTTLPAPISAIFVGNTHGWEGTSGDYTRVKRIASRGHAQRERER